MADSDQWSRWTLETRFGGNAERAAQFLAALGAIRDRVLDHAHLQAGEVVLDVGAGDGLLAFGALERVGPTGKVIFADISQPLLDHAASLPTQFSMHDRCRFVHTSADDLAGIADASVDVVTTRSVLIYVADKAAALRAFHRVLKPGGRISLFEPINRAMFPPDPNRFGPYDVRPVADVMERITRVYRAAQPASDPMIDFDERDLLHHAEEARFAEIHLHLQIDLQPPEPANWEVRLATPPNPLVPSLGELMAQELTPEEAARVTACLRPQVEAGRGGLARSVLAYLWATKGQQEMQS